jgi:epoxyqueuosine reductase
MKTAFVEALFREAHRLGFSMVGVSAGSPSRHLAVYKEWLASNLHGEMSYLAREDGVARRGDLRLTMEEVRSVVVVAQEYFQEDPPGVPEDPSRGVIARYARGVDYHDLMKARLQELLAWGRGEVVRKGLAQDLRGFAYVDTGPILERELAGQAGLGWFGKNTMLIHPKRGSYFFLGVLLLDLELPPTGALVKDHCGSCRRCLDACPTGALLGRTEDGAPLLDARRCISYLTIENKGPIPRELRKGLGNRVFGCDICQEVCPFSRRFSKPSEESAYSARLELDGPPLVELAERLLSVSGHGFRRLFADSPVLRAGREGLLRNVCVALGNWGSSSGVPMLARALVDSASLVRGHAAWALGTVGSPEAIALLSERAAEEEEDWVRDEIELGLFPPSGTGRGSSGSEAR